MRQRDVHVRRAPRERLAERALVVGVRVAVQQAHSDRLGVERVDHARDLLVIQLVQHAVGRAALAHADPPLGRDQRRGVRGAQPVEVGTVLAPERDQVGEALGGQQRGARALALQQRVGRHRHAVREGLDVARLAASAPQRGAHRVHDAARLVVGRARRLRRDQPPVLEREHRVGERAADVNPE